MIASDALNKLLRDVVNLLLETPDYAIAAKQPDAPRPTGAYGDVDFVADVSIGWEEQELENNTEDDDLTENISGAREITMSLGFYRDQAIDNARKVRTGLVRESIQTIFNEAKVGLGVRSEVREISESLENSWEERAQFDITLNAVGTDSDIVAAILSADISGRFDSRSKSYNFTIGVEQ